MEEEAHMAHPHSERERTGHQHQLITLDPDDLIVLVTRMKARKNAYTCFTTLAIVLFTRE